MNDPYHRWPGPIIPTPPTVYATPSAANYCLTYSATTRTVSAFLQAPRLRENASVTESRSCVDLFLAAQVHRLVSVILPGADAGLAEASIEAEGCLVGSPALSQFHDGNHQRLAAELGELKAAIKSEKEKHHGKLDKTQAELEALRAVNEGLQSKVVISFAASKSESAISMLCCGPRYRVDPLIISPPSRQKDLPMNYRALPLAPFI